MKKIIKSPVTASKLFYTSNDLIADKNHMLMPNVSLIIKPAKYVTDYHSYPSEEIT